MISTLWKTVTHSHSSECIRVYRFEENLFIGIKTKNMVPYQSTSGHERRERVCANEARGSEEIGSSI